MDLAAVRSGPVRTDGEVEPEALALAGEDVALAGPVEVTGRLSSAGEGRYYWRAELLASVRADCRRCLAPVEVPVSQSVGLVFAAGGDGSEDDGFHLIPPRAKQLDLTEALREELLLALPHFVECRPDCKGLCPRCGANLNDGPCGCSPVADPRWEALRALAPHQPETD